MKKTPAPPKAKDNVLLVSRKDFTKALASSASKVPETTRPGDLVFTSVNGGTPAFYMAGGWWWRWDGTTWWNAIELVAVTDKELADRPKTRRKLLKKLGYL